MTHHFLHSKTVGLPYGTVVTLLTLMIFSTFDEDSRTTERLALRSIISTRTQPEIIQRA